MNCSPFNSRGTPSPPFDQSRNLRYAGSNSLTIPELRPRRPPPACAALAAILTESVMALDRGRLDIFILARLVLGQQHRSSSVLCSAPRKTVQNGPGCRDDAT